MGRIGPKKVSLLANKSLAEHCIIAQLIAAAGCHRALPCVPVPLHLLGIPVFIASYNPMIGNLSRAGSGFLDFQHPLAVMGSLYQHTLYIRSPQLPLCKERPLHISSVEDVSFFTPLSVVSILKPLTALCLSYFSCC